MSVKKIIVRFVAETLVGSALAKLGDHVGDAVGAVIGKRIDPRHGMAPEEDSEPKPAPKKRGKR